MLLQAEKLTVAYGPVIALEDVSFEVDSAEIVAMIGPNGAGKSTALKAISGLLPASNGELTQGVVRFEGATITGQRTDQLVQKGIALVPEGRRLFPTMTVRENLEMGGYTRRESDGLAADIESVLGLFPHLRTRIHQKAGTLSSGEQQMLAIGRALMLRPKLLLADEPSLGLSPNFVESICEKLREINGLGVSILLVEQNVRMAMEIAKRVYVFEIGRITLEGDTATVRTDPRIQRAYLGGSVRTQK